MTHLHNIISEQEHTAHATNAGKKMHALLGRIKISSNSATGAPELINKIQNQPDLSELFSDKSQIEVPIAGTVKGRFISRRIDRLLIDHNNKTIKILDYKTDLNPEVYKQKYIAQLSEYAVLLRTLYPTYKISTYILWTHNFLLENIA